jgi:hypothetical protein
MCIFLGCVKWIISYFAIVLISDIQAQIRFLQYHKKHLTEEMEKKELAPFGVPGYYDRHLYGGPDSKYAGYLTTLPASDEEDVSNAAMV